MTTPGESLPLEDGSFDAAVMVHVGMNIPDKEAVFAEVHRVLAPGGLFARLRAGAHGRGRPALPAPLGRRRAVLVRRDRRRLLPHLEAAGFAVEDVEDRTPSTMGPPPSGPVTNAVVFGPVFVERIGNNVQATKAGCSAPMLVVARA